MRGEKKSAICVLAWCSCLNFVIVIHVYLNSSLPLSHPFGSIFVHLFSKNVPWLNLENADVSGGSERDVARGSLCVFEYKQHRIRQV